MSANNANISRNGSAGPIWLGVLITGPALFAAFDSMGAGHGDYVWCGVLFPVPTLIAIGVGKINALCVIIAALQFPMYGWILSGKVRVKFSRKLRAFSIVLAHAIGILLVRYFSSR